MFRKQTQEAIEKFLREKGLKELADHISEINLVDWVMLTQTINARSSALKVEDWDKLSLIVNKNEFD